MRGFRVSHQKEERITLDEMFKAYCRIDPISRAENLELLPLSQCDKWFQDANILDMDKVTTTDTGLCFFKFRKRAINYTEFLQFVQDLSNTKQLAFEDVKKKLQDVTKPVHPDDEIKQKSRKR